MLGFDVSPIAAAHNVQPSDLAKALTAHGWDFSKLVRHTDPDMREFCTRVVEDMAKKIAERNAKLEAIAQRQALERLARMTPEAKANPTMVCAKCDGKGRMGWCRHVENGLCFWCKGAGVIRPRGRR